MSCSHGPAAFPEHTAPPVPPSSPPKRATPLLVTRVTPGSRGLPCKLGNFWPVDGHRSLGPGQMRIVWSLAAGLLALWAAHSIGFDWRVSSNLLGVAGVQHLHRQINLEERRDLLWTDPTAFLLSSAYVG